MTPNSKFTRSRRSAPVNPRAGRRNLLFVIGIVPSILALLFATKVGLMLQANGAGISEYDKKAFADSGESFDRNLSLNFFEGWKAHFNRGDAQHQDKSYEEAIESYEAALESVPTEDQCTVRINLALTHELVGDAAIEQTQREEAIAAWQTGRDVLADGKCPTDAGRGEEQSQTAETIDRRLEDKLKQQDAPDPPPEDDKKKKPPKDDEEKKEETPEEKQKREELQERNQQGETDRRENQELQEGEGSGPRDPTW